MGRTNIRGNAPATESVPVPPTANQRTPAQVAGKVGTTPLGAAQAKHVKVVKKWRKAAMKKAISEEIERSPGSSYNDVVESVKRTAHMPTYENAVRGDFFTEHPVQSINGIEHVNIGGTLHPVSHGNIVHTPDGPVVGERTTVHRPGVGGPDILWGVAQNNTPYTTPPSTHDVLYIGKDVPEAAPPVHPETRRMQQQQAHPSTFGRTPAQWTNPPELRANDPDIPQGGFAEITREESDIGSEVENEAVRSKLGANVRVKSGEGEGEYEEEEEEPEEAEELTGGSRRAVPGAADALKAQKQARGILPTEGRGEEGGVRQRLTAGVPSAGGSTSDQFAALFGAGGGTELEAPYIKGKGRQYTSLEATRPMPGHPEGDYYDPEEVGGATAANWADVKAQDHAAMRAAVPANANISTTPGVDIPDDRANNVGLTHIARATWGENDRAGLLFIARAHAFAKHRGMHVGQLEQHHIDSIVESVAADGHPELDSVQAKVAEARRDVVRSQARGQEKAALLPSFLPPGAPTTKEAMATASPEALAELEEKYQLAKKFIAPEEAEHTTETEEPEEEEAPRDPRVGNNPFIGSPDQFHMSSISGTPQGYPAQSPAFGQTGGRGTMISGRAAIIGEAARSEREGEEGAPRLTGEASRKAATGAARSLESERIRNMSYLTQAADNPRAALAGMTLTHLGEIADEGGFPNKPILEEEGALITYPKGHRLAGQPKRDAEGNLQYRKRSAPVRSGKQNRRVATGISAAGAQFMRQTVTGFLRQNQAQDIENRGLEAAMTSDVLQQAQTAGRTPETGRGRAASVIAQGSLDIREASEAVKAEYRAVIPDVPESMSMSDDQREARLTAVSAKKDAELADRAARSDAHDVALDAYTKALREHGVGSPEHFAAEEAVNATGRAAYGRGWTPYTDAKVAKDKAAVQIKAEKKTERAKKGFTRINLDKTKAGRRTASSKGVTLSPAQAESRAQEGVAAETAAVTQRAMANATRNVNARKKRVSKKATGGEQESA